MTEQKNTLAKLITDCWKDEALKKRFIADPNSVLAEYGMEVPSNFTVKVVENSSNNLHITMPARPSKLLELTDAELMTAAGGGDAFASAFGCKSFVNLTSFFAYDCAECHD